MMKDKGEMIQIITEMLEKASREDLELFIIIIEGYLRKKK